MLMRVEQWQLLMHGYSHTLSVDVDELVAPRPSFHGLVDYVARKANRKIIVASGLDLHLVQGSNDSSGPAKVWASRHCGECVPVQSAPTPRPCWRAAADSGWRACARCHRSKPVLSRVPVSGINMHEISSPIMLSQCTDVGLACRDDDLLLLHTKCMSNAWRSGNASLADRYRAEESKPSHWRCNWAKWYLDEANSTRKGALLPRWGRHKVAGRPEPLPSWSEQLISRVFGLPRPEEIAPQQLAARRRGRRGRAPL